MIGALFPGQGSQHLGMGDFLFQAFPRAKEIFQTASEVLDLNMEDLIFYGSESELSLTKNAQPAILTVSMAQYRVLKDMGELSVTAGAGHSLGEYSALVASGALGFEEALLLVRRRGELMQKAVPQGQGGMMAVIGLNPEEVDLMCQHVCKSSQQGPLEPANYNTYDQTVVSGSLGAIQWAKDNFSPRMIDSDKKAFRLIPLKVSAPFHCSMMKPVEEKMRLELEKIRFYPPQWGIVQNSCAQLVTDPHELRQNLIHQIASPVRWAESIGVLREMEIEAMAEFGPGQVLMGLLEKIDKKIVRYSLNSISNLRSLDRYMEDKRSRQELEEVRKKESQEGD